MPAKAETWLFIINRFAGGGKAGRLWPQLESVLEQSGLHFYAVFTDRPRHAVALAESHLVEGYRRFVVLGGDGTLNEVLNGLYSHPESVKESCLTAFPCGTGNDWAALHKLPKNINGFVAMLKAPAFCQQDIGCAAYQQNGQTFHHYFANFIGSGFDSYLLEQMGSAQGRRLRYFYYVLKCLGRYRAPRFTLILNEKPVSAKALMVMACIGKYGGAGMVFAPHAKNNDRQFDVLHIGDMPFLRRLFSLALLFNGRIDQHRFVRTWRVPSLQLQADKAAAFQCDGEIVGCLPVQVENSETPLCIVVSNLSSQ